MSTLAVIILREPLYAESQAGNESDKEDCMWFGRRRSPEWILLQASDMDLH